MLIDARGRRAMQLAQRLGLRLRRSLDSPCETVCTLCRKPTRGCGYPQIGPRLKSLELDGRWSGSDKWKAARWKSRLLFSMGNEGSPDAVAGLVGIEGGVVSGVFNLESSGVRASDWRPRHDKHYHEA